MAGRPLRRARLNALALQNPQGPSRAELLQQKREIQKALKIVGDRDLPAGAYYAPDDDDNIMYPSRQVLERMLANVEAQLPDAPRTPARTRTMTEEDRLQRMTKKQLLEWLTQQGFTDHEIDWIIKNGGWQGQFTVSHWGRDRYAVHRIRPLYYDDAADTAWRDR